MDYAHSYQLTDYAFTRLHALLNRATLKIRFSLLIGLLSCPCMHAAEKNQIILKERVILPNARGRYQSFQCVNF